MRSTPSPWTSLRIVDRLADAAVVPGDHVALEDLDALLRAVEDLLMNLDAVADAKVRHVGFSGDVFDGLQTMFDLPFVFIDPP